MATARPHDWTGMREMCARLLERRTGADVSTWIQRVAARRFGNEASLRAWLTEQGVTGYAQ